MPKHPSFKVIQTDRGWKVEKPASLSAKGQRERCYFDTRDKAKVYAAKLKEEALAHGANAATIRPSLADEATRAAAILEPYGISLLEAAQRIVEIEEAKVASMDVATALSRFLLEKEDRSDSQRRAYEKMSTALLMEFQGRQLATITPAELHDHVDACTGTNSTFNSRATSIRTFWRWCSRLPRNWCDLKTIEVLERRRTRRNEIGVLTAGQCRNLLQTAEEHYPECVPAFAIGLFTGMRNSELERLEPGDITPDGITLSADSTKTNRRRFIEMPAPLAAWLRAYPVADTVLPANWFRKEKAVRRKAGWKVWCDLFDPPTAPEESPDWPDNGLRHTHASAMVALGKPLDSLTFEFGHSGGAAVLKAHYVGVMTKAEAIAIWSIGPNETTVPVIVEVPSPFSEQGKAAKAVGAVKAARKQAKP
ncbi:MAG: tyrosine-type recombinase/integrase, partial [Verrucomicrobia bacterium]|nr:tyrosine-type recombinase/integrase [Verrucomicrobiota bacterium]